MAWIDVVELIYPVGTVYTSMSETDPGSIFGGSWQLIDDNGEIITIENASAPYKWTRLS